MSDLHQNILWEPDDERRPPLRRKRSLFLALSLSASLVLLLSVAMTRQGKPENLQPIWHRCYSNGVEVDCESWQPLVACETVRCVCEQEHRIDAEGREWLWECL